MNSIKLILFIMICPLILLGQQYKEMETFVNLHKSDKSAINSLQNFKIENPNYKELKSLFQHFDKKVRKSTEGKIFERYLQALEKTQAGSKAPGISQFDLEGMPVSIADFRGKFVLINFWASWKSSSVKSTLELKKWYSDVAGEDFELLNISFDRDFDEWKNAIEKDSIPGVHISDLQGTNNYANIIFGVKVVPQNILINPEGIVVARNLYGNELIQKIKESINQSAD